MTSLYKNKNKPLPQILGNFIFANVLNYGACKKCLNEMLFRESGFFGLSK